MAHIALYRSWRPQTFGEIAGQEHITQTLRNSLKEGRFTHAYLFSGPRGTGKTSAAKIMAKAVNCERGTDGEPCNQCNACIRITEGSVMDVIELDAASNNGVDEIRDIRDKVKYAPTEVRRKVYIIDEVHMLSIGASNALLKTLEEPPPHVMFILATTEPHKLPVTIISRCQRFDFRRVALADQLARIKHICEMEGIQAEEEALAYIARLSDGGMRDALSLLDQIRSFTGQHITVQGVLSVTGGIATDQFHQLSESILQRDVGAVLQQIDRFMQEGKSAERCMEGLIHYLRDILMVKMVPNAGEVSDRVFDEKRLQSLAKAFTSEQIFDMIGILNQYQAEMKYASQPQTLFEVAMLKICSGSPVMPVTSASVKTSDSANAPALAASSLRTDSDLLLSQLQKKVESLELQLSELLRSSRSGEGGIPDTGELPSRQQSLSAGKAAEGVGPSVPDVPIGKRRTAKLKAYLQGKHSPFFKDVLSQWSQVLARVKESKVTVHAWLVNGEPVSADEATILVAFKNTIHRETTEKPGNKEIIEQVLAELFGQPLRLETIMQKDWLEADSEAAHFQAELLELQPDDDRPDRPEEDWIHEAIQLFGKDLVTIKED